MRKTRPVVGLLGSMMMAAGVSAQVVNYWRFENSPGFLNDSVGSTTLASSSVTQVTLPATGRGSSFLNYGSASAADFTEGSSSYLNGTYGGMAGDFTVEAFIHRDTNAGTFFDTIVFTGTGAGSPAVHGFNFYVRVDTALGNSSGELMLGLSDGTNFSSLLSGRVIPTGKDYYVAVTFSLSGSATFYVENLTDGGSLLTSTVIHSFASLNNLTTVQIGGIAGGSNNDVFFDGLIDNVRISNAALSPSALLINAIPEPGTYAFVAGVVALVTVGFRRARHA